MPNMIGGKKYKAGKHSDIKSEIHEINHAEGQSIGRVLKHLGDRNVLLYCNDSKERIAHIRGGLSKKKATIEVGDIVLYSNRGDSIGSDSSKERGDILAKYNQDIHRDLKRMPGINPKLFLQMERIDKHSILKEERIDEGFEFDAQSDASDSDAEEREKREVAKKEEEQKRSDARDSKYTIVENDDINIDDI